MSWRQRAGIPAPFTGLAVRLIVVLTLAILPLGLVSVHQSWKTLREANVLSETALLDHTQRAASKERELIQLALGAAEALGAATAVLSVGGEACDAMMARLVETDVNYSFAGFVDAAGQLTCASNGQREDLSTSAFYLDVSDSVGPLIDTRPNVADSGVVTLTVGLPVSTPDEVFGYIWITVPVLRANELLRESDPSVELLVFNSEGEILASEGFAENRRDMLPDDRSLTDLIGTGRYTFRGANRLNEYRHFAVVPIVENSVYALGSWPPDQGRFAMLSWSGLGLFFPVLMWLLCIGVAYVGLERLVLRHITRLRRWMRLYATDRVGFETAQLDNAPEELDAVAETFKAMTRQLSDHEIRQQENLEEKATLLREVHHRVKNNLQLISSIMNMQIRGARSDEAKRLLRGVQERVMALAAIHRRLYMSRKLALVQADQLLDDIVSQLVVVGNIDGPGSQIQVTTSFSPVQITPEQSLPLSLLATEAATNAVKFCSAPEGENSWITITLEELGGDRIRLSVINSHAPKSVVEAETDPDRDHSGLGIKLIDSFVVQLGGALERVELPDRYELHVTFERLDADSDEDEDEFEAP